MSFSSTPLGQGRRLDHHTFLNRPSASSSSSTNYIPRPSSPPRRQIPTTSYSYGAPTLGARSPPKASSQTPAITDTDDADQPALVRYARLKQRDVQSAPDLSNARASAPSSTIPPTKPERWSVKDTSVQIASAFHQAATTTVEGGMPPVNPNDAWTSGTTRKAVPRSSSVEYEKETQSTVNRRLGVPTPRPNRLNSRPINKAASLHHVPDSEAEEEHNNRAERAKSPLEHVVEVAKSFAPTSFFLRASSKEPEERSPNGANGGQHNTSSSYDYSAEEREYQASSQKPDSKRGAPAHRRNRIPEDNKAYRPTMSDLEETDDDINGDGKKTRRRKSKRGTAGGPPLTTLPVAGYDKRRKRKKGTKGNGVDDGEEEISSDEQDEEQEQDQFHVSNQQPARGTTPSIRAPSIPRASVPPSSRMSVPRGSVPPPEVSYSSHIESTDVEQALESVPEQDEPPEIDDEHLSNVSFSVGASLGRTVHWVFTSLWKLVLSIFSLISLSGRALTRTFQFALELFLLKPMHTLQTNSLAIAKYAVLALSMYLAWIGVQSGVSFNPLEYLPSLPSFPSLSSPTHAPYQPPAAPPVDFVGLSARLQLLESVLAGLSRDNQRSLDYLENEAKSQAKIISQLNLVESRIDKESVRLQEMETKIEASSTEELRSVQRDIDALRSQIQASRKKNEPQAASDEEARVKLRALEERMGSIEGDAKEALELSKSTSKTEVDSSNTLAWWNQLASGAKAGVTIKSADGQDVTSLIDLLVESAITKHSKDTLARRDFAMHSSGARVVPSLTSDTFEIRPPTFLGQVVGAMTGNGYAIGRPPVTLLHHELHDGHCWPFAGSQGQIGIALSAPALISDITIDHVAADVATDIRSAPRQMEVWGLVEGQDNVAKIQEWQAGKVASREIADGELAPEEIPLPPTLPTSPTYVRIANFTYNIYSSKHIQTFPVDSEIRDLGIDFGVVVLLVKNNWGKEEYTCLYRMRVHGQKLGESPLPYPEEFES